MGVGLKDIDEVGVTSSGRGLSITSCGAGRVNVEVGDVLSSGRGLAMVSIVGFL